MTDNTNPAEAGIVRHSINLVLPKSDVQREYEARHLASIQAVSERWNEAEQAKAERSRFIEIAPGEFIDTAATEAVAEAAQPFSLLMRPVNAPAASLPPIPSGTVPFASDAHLAAAMMDPRYNQNGPIGEVYRQEVNDRAASMLGAQAAE